MQFNIAKEIGNLLYNIIYLQSPLQGYFTILGLLIGSQTQFIFIHVSFIIHILYQTFARQTTLRFPSISTSPRFSAPFHSLFPYSHLFLHPPQPSPTKLLPTSPPLRSLPSSTCISLRISHSTSNSICMVYPQFRQPLTFTSYSQLPNIHSTPHLMPSVLPSPAIHHPIPSSSANSFHPSFFPWVGFTQVRARVQLRWEPWPNAQRMNKNSDEVATHRDPLRTYD